MKKGLAYWGICCLLLFTLSGCSSGSTAQENEMEKPAEETMGTEESDVVDIEEEDEQAMIDQALEEAEDDEEDAMEMADEAGEAGDEAAN